MTADAPTDADRYPTLTPAGRDMLRLMREHPHAPIFRNESGHRLSAEDVELVRTLEKKALEAVIDWQPNQPLAWVGRFIERCIESVPAYRLYGKPPASITAATTNGR